MMVMIKKMMKSRAFDTKERLKLKRAPVYALPRRETFNPTNQRKSLNSSSD
jgi:hypothetical protein